MTILKENDPVRKLLRSDIWAKAGYAGKRKKVVILDSDKGKPYKSMESYYVDVFGTSKECGHGTRVGFTIHEFAYDIEKIYYFDFTRNKDKVYEWLKAHRNEINLINVSMAGILGKETPDYLRIMELGIPLICAVGNDDSEKWISYPSRYEENVAVGATNREGTKVQPYSNNGLGIDTVVPSGIYIQRDDGYIWANNGTSFSSPTVTALYVQYDQWRTDNGLNNMTQDEAEELSQKLSEDIEDEGYDIKSGYGLLRLPLIIPTINKSSEPKQPEIIINPPSSPSTPSFPTPEVKKYYRVQCGAFGIKENANNYAEQIKLKGFSTYIVLIDELYKVQCGAFSVRENSEKLSKQLLDSGFNNFIVYY